MNKNDILKLSNSIKQQINAGRLHDAFAALRQLSEQSMAYEITDALKRHEQTYTYLLRYMAAGSDDPQRGKVLDEIVASLRALLDRLVRQLLTPETPTLYYNTLRTNRLRAEDSLSRTINAYMAAPPVPTGPSARELAEREAQQRRLFEQLWVQMPLSQADADAVRLLLVSDEPSHVKSMAVGALMLGLLEFYDPRRIALLGEAYANDDPKVSVRGLVGLLIGLFRYRNRKLDPESLEVVEQVREQPTWHSDLVAAFTELARTRDTERLSRKLSDEVIPGIMREGKDLIDRFRDEAVSPNDLVENPRWQEIIDKAGMTDKIREFSEIQESGGDVFMSTFAKLKQMPFFHELANWFIPFATDRSEYSALGDDVQLLARVIADAPGLCDSDKYSMMLSMSMVPENQRRMLREQLKAHSQQMAEFDKHTTDAGAERRALINSYVLDLYRFFKLFRRKGEFFSPFDSTFNLLRLDVLADDFDDPELIQTVAEAYFKASAWADARYLFERLLSYDSANPLYNQKVAFCLEREGRRAEAAEYYRRALTAADNDVWTLRRLAVCLAEAGATDELLQTYARLESLRPDDAGIALSYARALIDARQYDQAINRLYKIEFIDEGSTRHLRTLAWAQLLKGDRRAAADTYARVLGSGAKPEDYINLGHLGWACGDKSEAIDYYHMAAEQHEWDAERVIQTLRTDIPALQSIGIDTAELPLMIDAMLYSIEN